MSAFDLADMATIRAMSAATPKADHARMNWHVRFVLLLPKGDGFSGAIGSTMSTEVNLKPG